MRNLETLSYFHFSTAKPIHRRKIAKKKDVAENLRNNPILHPKMPSNHHSSEFLAQKIGTTFFLIFHTI